MYISSALGKQLACEQQREMLPQTCWLRLARSRPKHAPKGGGSDAR